MRDSTFKSPLLDLEVTQVLDLMPVGVWIVDGAGRILHRNPAGQRIWAAREADIEHVGQLRGWRTATGERMQPAEWAAARAISLGENALDQEIEIECGDGSRKVILQSATPIQDQAGRTIGAVVVNHDISERKRLEERLREMAIHDALTAAYSRRYLQESLAEQIARSRRYRTPLCLMMFDIDHFKQVNDEHGHPVGDRVLVSLVKCVRKELRGIDVLARYGGEEFVIVAPGINLEQAAQVAERIRVRIARARSEALPQITCSFGVCEYEGGDADSLIRRADELMYEAKSAGRNRVIARGGGRAAEGR